MKSIDTRDILTEGEEHLEAFLDPTNYLDECVSLVERTVASVRAVVQ